MKLYEIGIQSTFQREDEVKRNALKMLSKSSIIQLERERERFQRYINHDEFLDRVKDE